MLENRGQRQRNKLGHGQKMLLAMSMLVAMLITVGCGETLEML